MLVLAPVMCVLAGIAVSASLSTYMRYLDSGSSATKAEKKVIKGKSVVGGDAKGGDPRETVASFFVLMMTFFLITYAYHCVWATSEAYSSPSIVLSARGHDGKHFTLTHIYRALMLL
jgi:dolichyl-diphosphooligosaccharide--protein glycosyltransferase